LWSALSHPAGRYPEQQPVIGVVRAEVGALLVEHLGMDLRRGERERVKGARPARVCRAVGQRHDGTEVLDLPPQAVGLGVAAVAPAALIEGRPAALLARACLQLQTPQAPQM
jgi:hypothetical protein